jgi:hypothetical protein
MKLNNTDTKLMNSDMMAMKWLCKNYKRTINNEKDSDFTFSIITMLVSKSESFSIYHTGDNLQENR